ncbi:MAG: ABC transporter ATP-binding protein, partial [Alphaproteobacteria bacterium]|nr:ABC transporter ATP-binding protein [Alphaproteobacteria bacterium]
KARLLFCLMSYDAPHILLLDEPTNHLDIDAREALMQALNNYRGAVILVSHDPHLVDSVADRLWLVADGTCKPYDGDLEDYRKLIVQQRRREREDAKKEARGNKNEKPKDAPKLTKAEKEAAKLEQKLAELNAKKDALENDIANVCASGDTHQLKDLNTTHASLQKQIGKLEADLGALITGM